MSATAVAVDVDALKRELKQLKKTFEATHGRDLTKADIKANPEHLAKYNLWKQVSLEPKKTTTTAPPPAKAAPPSTPRPARKAQSKDKAAIVKKSVPAASEILPASSNNPFSPVKRKPAKQQPSSGKTLASQDPFSSSTEEPPNPFHTPSSSSTPIQGIFASTKPPRKAAPIPSAFPQTAGNKRPSASTTTSKSSSGFLHAGSPQKYKQMVLAVAKDTPRTKCRKRLRGEEVNETPGDKRRRLREMPKVESDDEEIGPSPVKPAVKGKVFKTLFDESAPIQAPAALFFSGPSQVAGPSKLRVPERTVSFKDRKPTPTPEPTSTAPSEGDNETQYSDSTGAEKAPQDLKPALSKKDLSRTTSKRTFSRIDSLDLRAPSPPPATGKGKSKSKWTNEKKKGKVEKSTVLVTEEDDEDYDAKASAGTTDLKYGAAGRTHKSSIIPANDSDLDEHDLMQQFRNVRRKPNAVATTEAPVETIDVELDEEMQRTLTFDSPTKRQTGKMLLDGVVVDDLVPEKRKVPEFWQVGDVAEEKAGDVEDWEDLPEGWGEDIDF